MSILYFRPWAKDTKMNKNEFCLQEVHSVVDRNNLHLSNAFSNTFMFDIYNNPMILLSSIAAF